MSPTSEQTTTALVVTSSETTTRERVVSEQVTTNPVVASGSGPLLFSPTNNARPSGRLVVDPTAAWHDLQTTLSRLEDAGYRTPCLDLSDLFLSDDATDRAAAVPWCLGCPALSACGRYADAADEPAYVWAGIDRAPRYRGGTNTKETSQ